MDLPRQHLVLAIAALALALMLPCGSAFAAPPSEPPGKSGDAPGHQKDKDHGARSSRRRPAPSSPKRVAADVVVTAVVAPPAEPEAQAGRRVPPLLRTLPASRSTTFRRPPRLLRSRASRRRATRAATSSPSVTRGTRSRSTSTLHGRTSTATATRTPWPAQRVVLRALSLRGQLPKNETPSGPGVLRPDHSAVVAEAGRGISDPGRARPDRG